MEIGEMIETTQDRNPASISAGSTRKPHDETDRIAGPLGSFLHDGAMLDHDQEIHHATTLSDARKQFAAIVDGLPARVRNRVRVVNPNRRRSEPEWTLEVIDACYERLASHGETSDGPDLSKEVGEARLLKRRIDAARDALILSNLRLVPHVVKQTRHFGIPFMDLVQEGNIGLMKAVDRFDAQRGYRFSTYAFWWIRQAVSRAISNKARMIRLPEPVRRSVISLKRVVHELESALGRSPDAPEIAEQMDVSATKVEELLTLVPEPHRLENFGSDEESAGLLDILLDPDSPTPLELTLKREMRERLLSAMTCLTPRERRIVRLRYGFDRDRDHTLEEIGKKMGLSRERVRQLERGALIKIHNQEVEFLGDTLPPSRRTAKAC